MLTISANWENFLFSLSALRTSYLTCPDPSFAEVDRFDRLDRCSDCSLLTEDNVETLLKSFIDLLRSIILVIFNFVSDSSSQMNSSVNTDLTPAATALGVLILLLKSPVEEAFLLLLKNEIFLNNFSQKFKYLRQWHDGRFRN